MEIRREEGVAVIMALMAMMMMTALGTALMLITSSEAMIAANFRIGGEALHAAEAALERSIGDLTIISDWNTPLNGTRPGVVDGPPGERMLPDGSTIDLDRIVSFANCDKPIPCTDAEMDANTAARPWGQNNPRWQLFSYGRLVELLPTGTINSPFYVVVLVGDDPSETDDAPAVDGGPPVAPAATNPGRGVIAVRAEAFGPRGAHSAIELTAAKTDRPAVRILSWRDVR